MRLALVVVAIATITGSGTLSRAADSGSTAQRNHPEWAAVYNITPALQEGAAYDKKMSAGLGGFEPVNPDLDKVIKAHLRPWALAKLAEPTGQPMTPARSARSAAYFGIPPA
jgi:hypothetical protein